jgi:hypothetical protein
LKGRRPVIKNASSRAERFPKASGSGDQLSHSPVHANARDGVDYGGSASSERWQNLDRFKLCAAVAGQEFI